MQLRSTFRSKTANIGFGLVLVASAGAALWSCDAPPPSSSGNAAEDVGSVGLALALGAGATVSTARYTISNTNGFSRTGTVDVSQSSTLAFSVGGLPAGSGYTIQIIR